MSKTLDLLSKLQNKRNKPENWGLSPKGTVPNSESKGTVPKVFFLILTVILLGFNGYFIFMFSNYASGTRMSLQRIATIESLITHNTKKIDSIASETEALNKEINELYVRIRNVYSDMSAKTQTDDQLVFIITNLTKAKDILYKRISSLEAELTEK